MKTKSEPIPEGVPRSEVTIYENLKEFCKYQDFREYFKDLSQTVKPLPAEERIAKLQLASLTLKTLTSLRPIFSLNTVKSDQGNKLIVLMKEAFLKADTMDLELFMKAMLEINNGCNYLVSGPFKATKAVGDVLAKAAA